MPNKSKRIIFYRIGAIGDIVHTLPLIKYTKKQNPTALIELILGSSQMAELLQVAAPYIDRLWCIDHRSVLNKPISLFANRSKYLKPSSVELELYESIQSNPVDDFIYLHSNVFKANLINFLFVKADKLFIYKNRVELSAVVNYSITYLPQLESEMRENACGVLEYKTLCPASSLCHREERSDVTIPTEEILTVAAAQLPQDDKSYLCIVPGVGKLRPSRAYPLIKWVWLIEKILQETNQEIYILGGPDENELSIEFEKMISLRKEHLNLGLDYSRIKNLIGKTTLVQLAEILAGANKLYSADTGILHIAAALDVPIESVFSITLPQRFGPFNPNAKVLTASDCACETKCKYKKKHCSNLLNNYAACAWSCEFSA